MSLLVSHFGAQPTYGDVLPTVDSTAAIQAAPGSTTLCVKMPLGNYLFEDHCSF